MGKLARPFQLSVWAMGGVLGTATIAKGETVKLVEDGDRYRLDVCGAWIPCVGRSNSPAALVRPAEILGCAGGPLGGEWRCGCHDSV